jgi:hypothetical protein
VDLRDARLGKKRTPSPRLKTRSRQAMATSGVASYVPINLESPSKSELKKYQE